MWFENENHKLIQRYYLRVWICCVFVFVFLDIKIAKLSMLLDTEGMDLKREDVVIRIGIIIETMKKNEIV